MALKKKKIGLVGCGAIGSSLARRIVSGALGACSLAGVYDIDPARSARLARRCGSPRLARASRASLVAASDLVIEAAGAEPAYAIARTALAAGKDVMVMSVGGILARFRELALLAQRTGGHIYIPSGAIAGIDALKAARRGAITRVTLTTTKHPAAYRGAPYVARKGIRLEKIKKDTLLFKGNAATAVREFPQNINVSAVLSIAGIGSRRTVVRIVASPSARANTHEVEIESDAGRIVTRTENVVHPDNPKTSALAVRSAAASLQQISSAYTVGT